MVCIYCFQPPLDPTSTLIIDYSRKLFVSDHILLHHDPIMLTSCSQFRPSDWMSQVYGLISSVDKILQEGAILFLSVLKSCLISMLLILKIRLYAITQF